MHFKNDELKRKFALFMRFLKEKGAFNNYKLEVGNVPVLIHKDQPCIWISGAFPWADTRDGFSFWSQLNDEWVMFCKKNKLYL